MEMLDVDRNDVDMNVVVLLYSVRERGWMGIRWG